MYDFATLCNFATKINQVQLQLKVNKKGWSELQLVAGLILYIFFREVVELQLNFKKVVCILNIPLIRRQLNSHYPQISFPAT